MQAATPFPRRGRMPQHRTSPHALTHYLSTLFLAAPLVVLVCLSLLLAACGGSNSTSASSQPVTLTVFAGSSLKEAFTEIGDKFHSAHSNVTVTFNFGGSDALAQQITQGGAPADVFASANTKQMDVVVSAGDINGTEARVFAHNRIVVVFPTNNPGNIQTLQDLAKPGLKLVLAAASVPVGQYALDFFTKASQDPTFGADYKDAVLKYVVSSEADVKSVLAKVSLGEADAGIVYTTDAATKADGLGTLAIPDSLNNIATYPIAPIKASQQAATALQFIDYVLSADGQAALKKYGFLPSDQGPQYIPPTA